MVMEGRSVAAWGQGQDLESDRKGPQRVFRQCGRPIS